MRHSSRNAVRRRRLIGAGKAEGVAKTAVASVLVRDMQLVGAMAGAGLGRPWG